MVEFSGFRSACFDNACKDRQDCAMDKIFLPLVNLLIGIIIFITSDAVAYLYLKIRRNRYVDNDNVTFL